MNEYPSCMTRLAEHQYRCPEYGFVVKTEVYPIRCFKLCPRQPDDSKLVSGQDYEARPKAKRAQPHELERYGPGTELKRFLAWFGITMTADCECESYADQMDCWGAEGCRKQIETIVDWMETEARKRPVAKYVFTRAGARRLVRLAIWRAERSGPP